MSFMVDFIFEKKRHTIALLETSDLCNSDRCSSSFCGAHTAVVLHHLQRQKKKERIENPCCLLIRKKLRYRANCVLLWLLVLSV